MECLIMLRINRLKIKIETEDSTYGFDKTFSSGLNFITSDDNTKGKSSVLIAIYYCLGFEEIIGGVNEKTLTSVYKSVIEDDGKSYAVLESGAFLEISNGEDTVTIYRAAKKEGRDSKLVTVFFSTIDDMFSEGTTSEDYYVHMANAANNGAGFHAFIEKFLKLNLPIVPGQNGAEYKLYLQLIFSAMAVEQKNGWAGIYAGMPYLGVREAKKRVTEFILGMDTFEITRRKNECREREQSIVNKWHSLIKDIQKEQIRHNVVVFNIPNNPEILSDDFESNIFISYSLDREVSIHKLIERKKAEIENLKSVRPRIGDNIEELQAELTSIESQISERETAIEEVRRSILFNRRNISRLIDNIEVLRQDLSNNKDALKLKKLGSGLNFDSFKGVCPTCGQNINDTLLTSQHDKCVMSIEESIKHLEAQSQTLEFALQSRKSQVKTLEDKLEQLRNEVMELQSIARSIRRDLCEVDDSLSETVIYKRIILEKEVEELEAFNIWVANCCDEFVKLSTSWKILLADKAKLPKKSTSAEDATKIKKLEQNFKNNLGNYNYTSISNIRTIELSEDNYLPTIDNFDMKFDSSASDNIRGIWAYTIALLQTSIECEGNHFGTVIFDEPAQHSINANDAKAFFDSIISIGDKCQVIIGMTINNSEIRKVISEIDMPNCTVVHISNKAFQKM